MRQRRVLLGPSSACQFYVEALQYVPQPSYEDGYTLVMFHAMNLHKETFEVLLEQMMEKLPTSVRYREAWVIENPNHGRSSVMNQAILKSQEYIDHWNVLEYTRAVHVFLSSTSVHGVDFRKRKLIGMAHSGGGPSLMMLPTIQPTFAFRAFVMMDPAILPPRPPSYVMTGLFENWAKSKKDTWPSRDQAYEELSKSKAFSRWNPKLVKHFADYGLREIDESGAVTLACTGRQEAAFYRSPDMVGPPAESFVTRDEYGGKTEDFRAFLTENINKYNAGSVRWMEKGGHMLPQVVPIPVAEAVADALMQVDAPSARL
ncbi:hypothetical protein AMATHDRAFT_7234 [Amanita thiersii Skay4041]|uniref:AB hydrolase-1 domain-containing protein n=1 Tax=Amanita thiersii Skay4041 TaxID=703135 RepID=A0A2A9NGU7_9AGAR|nr:hypothetical protein AMATHDRAFT_7234 [Amanita thiersii Skay4041]